ACEVNLFTRRTMHWITTDGGRYALATGTGYLRLDPDGESTWSVTETWTAPGARPRVLASGLPLGYAQGFAEDRVRELGTGALVNPRARWRQEPATEKQLTLLRRKRIRFSPDITKGDASDLLVQHFAEAAS